MKLGIVGSSYSLGNHKIRTMSQKKHGDYSPKFEDVIKTCFQDKKLEIYNFSALGKGSEQFLSRITYLKKIYNIDVLLMEVVNDRELRQSRIPFKAYNDILKDYLYVDQFYKWLCRHHDDWLTGIDIASLKDIKDIKYIPKFLTRNEIKKYVNIQQKFLLESELFFTCKNILTSLDLCILLKIPVVLWESNITIHTNEMFKEIMLNDNLHFVENPNNEPFIFWYRKNYGRDAYVDRCHLSVECDQLLITDHIVPVLKKVMQ